MNVSEKKMFLLSGENEVSMAAKVESEPKVIKNNDEEKKEMPSAKPIKRKDESDEWKNI